MQSISTKASSLTFATTPTPTESLANMLGYHLKITSQGATLHSSYVDNELRAFHRASKIAQIGDRVTVYESYRCADKWEDQEIVRDMFWEGNKQ